MPMNTDLRLKWAAALRSGEYKQGTGALCKRNLVTDERSYCCLGVLVAIEGCRFAQVRDNDRFKVKLEDHWVTTRLTYQYASNLGLSTAAQDKFIDANDTLDWTFNEIADAVEAGTILGVEI